MWHSAVTVARFLITEVARSVYANAIWSGLVVSSNEDAELVPALQTDPRLEPPACTDPG